MNSITKSDFVRLGVEGMKKVMPTEITAEDEVIGVFVNPKDVIVLSDMNIVVARNLRALEQKARVGMPPVQKLGIASVKSVEPKQVE